MCKKFLLFKQDSGTRRQYITWLMAGSRKEALEFIVWFRDLNPRNTLFHLEDGQNFELIEEQLEMEDSLARREAPESAIA